MASQTDYDAAQAAVEAAVYAGADQATIDAAVEEAYDAFQAEYAAALDEVYYS